MSETTTDRTAVPELIWEEPPPAGAGRPETILTEEIKDALKENKNKWVRLPQETSQGTVTRLKKRHTDFEFTARKAESEEGEEPKSSKTVNVWVRYIGPQPRNAGD